MKTRDGRKLAPALEYKAVAVGGSAGGFEALEAILALLPSDFKPSILVVQHLHPNDNGSFARQLARTTRLSVIEPCDKERLRPGCVYVAPANYHMLVEQSGAIALSIDEKVNWSRPSIDVLFKSAAQAWGRLVIAIILSGANADGAKGMREVKEAGGLAIVQDPATAQVQIMPQAAIDLCTVDEVLCPEEIGRWLIELGTAPKQDREHCGETHD